MLEPCLSNTPRQVCPKFPKGVKWEPKFTLVLLHLAWQDFFASLDSLRGYCAILRPLRGTLREVGWRPPGRRGVRGGKPPPFSSRCSNTHGQGSADLTSLLAPLASFWHPFGSHLAPTASLWLPFDSHFAPFVSLWLPFVPFWHPFGSRLASFWSPLAPFGFLIPPFRGSPWNCNAFPYRVVDFCP